MAQELLGLRERKKARTRQIIVDAALHLFQEAGFENVSVDDIAAAAEVSRRTFFRYFATKDAVIFSHHRQRLFVFMQALTRRRSGGKPGFHAARDALLEFGSYYKTLQHELYCEWRIICQSPSLISRDMELDYQYESALARFLAGVDDDGAEPDLASRILAAAMFATVRTIMDYWFSSGCAVDLQELGRRSFDLLELPFIPAETGQ